MFNPFVWWSEYRLARLKLQLEAKNAPYSVMAEAIKAQSEFINQYFSSFKVTEIPTSTIIRDEDEYRQEMDRLDPHAALRESLRNASSAGMQLPDLAELIGR